MEVVQLSLLSNEEEQVLTKKQNTVDKQNPVKKQKKAKLGRYERIQRDLETEIDPYKIFVQVETSVTPNHEYTFIDTFCGAGGMTQGFVNGGFTPVASVEINPIASATHRRNFPQCHHLCGDIKDFSPKQILEKRDM